MSTIHPVLVPTIIYPTVSLDIGVYAHISVAFRKLTTEGLEYYSSYDTRERLYLSFLCITCQIDGKDDNCDSYGWKISYKEFPKVELYHAEAMYKTLRLIEQRYSKWCENNGVPDSFGTFVNAIATPVKAQSMAILESKDNYSYLSLEEGVKWIDSMVKLRKKQCQEEYKHYFSKVS